MPTSTLEWHNLCIWGLFHWFPIKKPAAVFALRTRYRTLKQGFAAIKGLSVLQALNDVNGFDCREVEERKKDSNVLVTCYKVCLIWPCDWELRLPKRWCSFHVEESSPSTWSEATTQVPSASQVYVPLSFSDTQLMYKRATFQSCSTTTLRPSGCNGWPSFFHWALTGLENWQMNSAGWFSNTRRSSISLTTSTVGSEVGVRGSYCQDLAIRYNNKNQHAEWPVGFITPKWILIWCFYRMDLIMFL